MPSPREILDYLIGSDGRIAYQGGEGPFGFKPDELEQAIERHLSA